MCDTMVSLTDAGVLFAKNSDRDPNEAQVLEWHAAEHHSAGSTLSCTWIDVPQVASTNAVVVSRPWWTWGAEMGANEHGVVIGNQAVFTKGPAGQPALLGMDLLRLALERASTADAAVEVIVSLLETHGQGGPHSHDHPSFTYDNSFIVADPGSAIVLETAGRDWASENVPMNSSRSISNGLMIPGFADAHSDRIRTYVSACAIRQPLTQRGAAKSNSPADLMTVLQSHGETKVPNYSLLNGAMSAPCMHAGGVAANSQTVSSWVSDLRTAPLHWATGTAAPCTSLFKPVRVDQPVDLGAPPDNKADPSSLWWAHERLHRKAMVDPSASLARFAAARDRIQRGWLEDPPDSAHAFTLAQTAEAAWHADLVAAELPDTRPLWVRRYWSIQNRKANMDVDQVAEMVS